MADMSSWFQSGANSVGQFLGIVGTAPYQAQDFGPAANPGALQAIAGADAGGITPTSGQQADLINLYNNNAQMTANNTAPLGTPDPSLPTGVFGVAGYQWGQWAQQLLAAFKQGVTPDPSTDYSILIGILLLAALLWIVAKLL